MRGVHLFYMKECMTENNIFQEIQEDLERQKLEALWKRYGGLVIVALVVLIAATAGVSAWRSWHSEKNQKATAEFLSALKPSDETKEIQALEDFAQRNHGVTQAAFAQLRAASLAAKNGNQDQAIQIYDAVAKDSSVDPAFRQLADLMSVRLQLDTGTPADLQKRLEPLMTEKAPWRYTAMEYSGYLALRAGDKAKAKQIFTDLSQNASVPQSLGVRAADMLRYVSE